MMATFMNSVTRKKAKDRAAANFRDIASSIQSSRDAREDLDRENVLAEQRLSNEGNMNVAREDTSRTLQDRRLSEAGETGRTAMSQAGQTYRQTSVNTEQGRQFDAEHALDRTKDAREGRESDLAYGMLQEMRDPTVAHLKAEKGAETVTNEDFIKEALTARKAKATAEYNAKGKSTIGSPYSGAGDNFRAKPKDTRSKNRQRLGKVSKAGSSLFYAPSTVPTKAAKYAGRKLLQGFDYLFGVE